MDSLINNQDFYEKFWSDEDYTFAYALDSAVRDRFPAIQKVWGSLRSPEKVLDFGCGNGVLTYWLSANGFGKEILGVDISKKGISNAQKRFATSDSGNLSFQALEPNWRFSHFSQFDVIVASHVLEHLHDPGLTLSKILPMSNWFIFEVPLENCLSQTILWSLRRKSQSENELGHVNFWTKRGFQSLLESYGLLLVRDYHYASAPFSPYNNFIKRQIEEMALAVLGLNIYSKFMATHYAVLATKSPSWQSRISTLEER